MLDSRRGKEELLIQESTAGPAHNAHFCSSDTSVEQRFDSKLDTQARAGGLKEKLSGLDRRGKAKVSNKLAVKTRQPSKKKKKRSTARAGRASRQCRQRSTNRADSGRLNSLARVDEKGVSGL